MPHFYAITGVAGEADAVSAVNKLYSASIITPIGQRMGECTFRYGAWYVVLTVNVSAIGGPPDAKCIGFGRASGIQSAKQAAARDVLQHVVSFVHLYTTRCLGTLPIFIHATLGRSFSQLRRLDEYAQEYATFARLANQIQHLGGLTTSLLFVDVEMASDLKSVTEVGLYLVDFTQKTSLLRHYIVAENVSLINPHCPGDRFGFAWGESQILPLRTVLGKVQQIVGQAARSPNGYVIGHSVRASDKIWLEAAGIDFSGLEFCDIAIVHRYLEGLLSRTPSLTDIVKYYSTASRGSKHNAGNDTIDTVLAFEGLLVRVVGYHARLLCFPDPVESGRTV